MTDSPAFTPVPTASTRRDGWTPDKQRAFIAQLARCGVVSAAARAVGMSPKSAYALRKRPGAESFADAWDMASDDGRAEALSLSIDRAINGFAQPVFYRGRQVGERLAYNDRLLMAAIRAIDPADRTAPITLAAALDALGPEVATPTAGAVELAELALPSLPSDVAPPHPPFRNRSASGT